MRPFVGENEVMEINMQLANKHDFTVDNIEDLTKDMRAELIDGQIFYFATPSLEHQELLGNLYYILRSYIEEHDGSCNVYVAPVSVWLNQDNKTYLEPDVIVVCDPDKLQEDGCNGAPDLIIEIASKSTQQRDYGLKMLKYRTAGVKEYWIVDPLKQTVMVYWFENENLNCLYSMQDEIEFHLFPGLNVQLLEN